MVDEYSGLWAEDDPKEKAKRKAAAKKFLQRMKEQRLPSVEEVKKGLASKTQLRAKKAYYAKIHGQYLNYKDLVAQANKEYKHEWDLNGEDTETSFDNYHARDIERVSLFDEKISLQFRAIQQLFDQKVPGITPSKILWEGKNRRERITKLIESWTDPDLSRIYLNNESIDEYIDKRFFLGDDPMKAGRGEFIVWNDTNKRLLWWLTCLVEAKLINVDISTGKVKGEDEELHVDAVKRIPAFAANHFLKYKSDTGIDFFDKGALLTTYNEDILDCLGMDQRALKLEDEQLPKIWSEVQEIAAL